ncbi:MAG TPA: nicotinate phosphoribosyltransferase [Actinomycetota bacterium]|nr:nicotinate phosphoribosyltransferase [Actinomycetota bacterium]
MGRALHTDLYELNMAASYLRRGMTDPATFSLFVRHLPPRWGFLVACGLRSCLEYLEELAFTEEDLAYLAAEQGYDEEALEGLRRLRFTGDVWAVPEGRVVYAGEPLLEVTAPLPEAQLVETFLLNQITYQTAIASKAARCTLVAGRAALVDFSMRRVHGTEAAIAVARASAIAGFSATSNVEAARTLGIPASGTMAHSYVEAFDTEMAAFRAFAEDHPDRVILLVDTYDTDAGVEKAIEVGRELAARSHRLVGIRLDSGDLGELARRAREALDAAGMEDVQILASGGLDEHVIAGLTAAGAPIDAFGVGTKMGVSADAPYLDTVYKLVAYGGRPVAKLSTGKATLPWPKQVWRLPDMAGDVIAVRDEAGPPGAEPLLRRAMGDGRTLLTEGLEEPRRRFAAELEALPEALRSLDGAPYPVDRSERLQAADRELRETIAARELR